MRSYATFSFSKNKVSYFDRKFIISACLGAVVLISLAAVGVSFAVRDKSRRHEVFVSNSTLGSYQSAAISSDGIPCSDIGINIIQQNGTTMDGTLAALFCLGVVNTQSMGLGGGFFMTYYDKETQTAYYLDSREEAPGAAYKDMYDGDPDLSRYGGLAVAVPGEMRGYYAAYQRFGGGVSWAAIIEPTIALCDIGFPVNFHMANALKSKEEYIMSEPTMSVFINPETGELLQEGDILKRPDLAATLRILQNDPDAVYTGQLADGFIQDLESLGSIITLEDMHNYQPKWKDIYTYQLKNDFKIYAAPPPSSGLILGYILNILNNYDFSEDSVNEENIDTTYQRIIEAFKFGYAKRTELGDPDFTDQTPLINNLTSSIFAYESYTKIRDDQTSQDPAYYGSMYDIKVDHGTSHISVLGPDGDAVAVTSTVNLYFGAIIMSQSTGILLNDEMDDFSAPNITNNFGLPPFEDNYIEPGKRPVSSMCPTILTDNSGDVRLIVGAAGGTQITSATAWVALHNLLFGYNIKEAIDGKRLHHQLYPMEIAHESGFDQDIVETLRSYGHEIADTAYMGGSVVCGIHRDSSGTIFANSDHRKGGDVAGF